MKKLYTYFCWAVFLAGLSPITSKTENSIIEDYSKMSAEELNAAFILSVKKHRLENMEQLIQAGADVNALVSYTDTSGDCDWDIKSTALIYAVRHNMPDMVQVLLKVKNKLTDSLDKAFSEAIKRGYISVVKEFIAGGININYADEDGRTPLILAVMNSRAISEFSTQAHARGKSRWEQRREIIKILLRTGASIDCADKYGRTALMEAVLQHDLTIVQELLQDARMYQGAFFGFGVKPINYADRDGNTALMLAIEKICSNYFDSQGYNICLNSQEIVEKLFHAPGCDHHHKNKNGMTALILLEKLHKKSF